MVGIECMKGSQSNAGCLRQTQLEKKHLDIQA